MQADMGRPFQGVQGLDGRFELHAVVGRLRLATVQRLASLAADQQDAPASGTGIPPAGAIGIYLNDFGQSGYGKPG